MTALAPPRRRGRTRPLAAWRNAKALQLAVEGHTYETIAREVGFANRGTAYRVVRKALDDQVADNVRQLRETEVARPNALQAAIWPAALAGHVDAVRQVLAITDKRAKLLGLYKAGKHRIEKPLRPDTVTCRRVGSGTSSAGSGT